MACSRLKLGKVRSNRIRDGDLNFRVRRAALSSGLSRSTHDADEIMAEIVAKRLVEHLERAGFIIMKRSATANRLTRPNP